jgi:glucose/mannose transport system permease protein
MGFSLFNFRQSLPRTIWDWLILIFLLLCTIFFLMPIYVMVVTGFKQSQDVSLSTMWHLPAQVSGGGFLEAWRRLYPNLGNSLQLTIPATIFSSILGAVNGYIFAKWKFRGANALFALLVFGMFIPYQSILIPLIQFLQQIKLYGTVWGLVLVHVIYGLPICSLIFRNFFANIPDELVEAARIDGAGRGADVLACHVAAGSSGFRCRRHLSIYQRVERFPLWRDHSA